MFIFESEPYPTVVAIGALSAVGPLQHPPPRAKLEQAAVVRSAAVIFIFMVNLQSESFGVCWYR